MPRACGIINESEGEILRQDTKTLETKKPNTAQKRLMPFDWPLAIIVLTLVVFGLVMVFSSSYATGIYRKDDAFVFIRKQIVFAFIGLAAMIAASVVDYHIFHRFAWPIMGVTLILLVIVLFMPAINNAKRWITIPGIGTLQPSDVAKFAVIVLFAHIISVNHDKMKRFSYGVLPFITIMGVIAGLMLLEPHLSGTVLIFGIGAIMMFVGGTGLLWFGIGDGNRAIVCKVLKQPHTSFVNKKSLSKDSLMNMK